jgi:hypothetical protein
MMERCKTIYTGSDQLSKIISFPTKEFFFIVTSVGLVSTLCDTSPILVHRVLHNFDIICIMVSKHLKIWYIYGVIYIIEGYEIKM